MLGFQESSPTSLFCSRISPRMPSCHQSSCLLLVIFRTQILCCVNHLPFVFSPIGLERFPWPPLFSVFKSMLLPLEFPVWYKTGTDFSQRPYATYPVGTIDKKSVISELAGSTTPVWNSCLCKDFPGFTQLFPCRNFMQRE